jgi:hypothetical protein
MIDTAPRPDASLLAFLSARARHASDERLVTYAVGGFLATLGVLYWRGAGWEILVAMATSVFSFGLWGIIDRELGERTMNSVRLVVFLALTRVAIAIVGFLCAAFVALALLGKSLGRIIS